MSAPSATEPASLRRVLSRAIAAEQLQRIHVEQCRRRLSAFVKFSWAALEPDTPLDWGWHIEAICDHVQWVFEEWAKKRHDPSYVMAVQNLLINIPPRCLKSRIVSVCAVAWAWLRWPSMTFICLSANPRVSSDNARACRDLITASWYRTWFQPAWQVRDDQDAVSDFALGTPNAEGGWDMLGGRKSRGWDSPITGEGADCLIPDDPHDAEEVHSKAARQHVVSRWDRAIWNRVRDLRSSIRIGVMQRLRQDDWSGHILAASAVDRKAPQWCHLKIPLVFKESRACRTAMPVNDKGRYDHGSMHAWRDPRAADGEVMDPLRFPDDVIAAERLRMGSMGFAGQMDQEPAPIVGGIFKRPWLRFFRIEDQPVDHMRPRPEGCVTRDVEPARVIPMRNGRPAFDWIDASVDCAFKKLDDGSDVSIQFIAGIGADRFVLLDSTRPRDFNETIADMRVLLKDRPDIGRKVVEDKANGPAVINQLRSEISGMIALNPGSDSKEARWMSCQPMVEAGNLYLLDGAPWLEEYVDQFCTVPGAGKNDRVDATTQLIIDRQPAAAGGGNTYSTPRLLRGSR